MVKRYGEDAVLEAAERADQLLDEGDMPGAETWHRILNAIERLQAKAPADGEKEHKSGAELTRLPQIKARRNHATPCACVNALLVGVMPRASGAPMPSYRYCFLDSVDRVAEFQVIASETDGKAQTRADRLLAACDYPSIEVWDHSRSLTSSPRRGASPVSDDAIERLRARASAEEEKVH